MASVDLNIPGHIPNFIDGQERPAGGGATLREAGSGHRTGAVPGEPVGSAGHRGRRIGRSQGAAGMG